MLFCVIHCVDYSFKTLFYFRCKLCYEMVCNNSLTLLFCFCSVCYGCMNPTTYVWVTCRDPRTCGLSGSYGMPDSLLFSPFEVRDDSNPSGDGLPHLSRIKLGGTATLVVRDNQ